MTDVYQEVTDRIIAALEHGEIPWQKPWTGTSDGAIKRRDGKPYSLLNQLLLGKPGEYMTFDECKREGGHVKKGAKSRFVVFWKFLKTEMHDQNGQPMFDQDGKQQYNVIPMLKYFNVFHLDDCEGLKPKWTDDTKPSTAATVEEAEGIITDYAARAKLTIEHHKQDEAYYSPSRHIVRLPEIAQFAKTSEYYSTVFHELTHSTGHKSLLNRFAGDATSAAFGSENYSKEELVAELGACTILNRLGRETASSFRNNAAYIQSWLSALKNDKRLIVSAAARAEKAVKLILNEQTEEVIA